MSTSDSDHDEGDARLVSELSNARRRLDRAPDELRMSARTLLAMHTLDAELALLEYDSTLDEGVGALRGGSEARRMTFTGTGFQLDLEVSWDHEGARLVGQVLPPAQTHVGLRHQDGHVVVDTDAAGSFVLEGVRRSGPCRFELRLPGGRALGQTQWVTL